MNISEAIIRAEKKLADCGADTPRLDAEVLLAHALGRSRSGLCLVRKDPIDPDIAEKFDSWIDKRSKGCPVAYITGTREFWSLPIRVSPDVLIPRPETETVVEEALKIARALKRPCAILDVCTGSGCIAAALAQELPEASIVATDLSERALAVAQSNLSGVGRKVKLLAGDLFRPIEDQRLGPFDVITANPPYISDSEMPDLPCDVRDFEPRAALAAGPSGLDFISRILKDALRHLVPGGWLLMEIGAGQSAAAIGTAAEIDGYDTIKTANDLAGIERVVMARKSAWKN
ncbi:MAG: peptide chain release factor N(5)-glutamine methyltransferase [bacterium]